MNDELYHFGVKGMKWGHRKTKSGKETHEQRVKRDLSNMDDRELNQKLNRMRMEQQYAQMVGLRKKTAKAALVGTAALAGGMIAKGVLKNASKDASKFIYSKAKEYGKEVLKRRADKKALEPIKAAAWRNAYYMKGAGKGPVGMQSRHMKPGNYGKNNEAYENVKAARAYAMRWMREAQKFDKANPKKTKMKHSDEYSDELYHFGVKGMKWGVRKRIKDSYNRKVSENKAHYKKYGISDKEAERYAKSDVRKSYAKKALIGAALGFAAYKGGKYAAKAAKNYYYRNDGNRNFKRTKNPFDKYKTETFTGTPLERFQYAKNGKGKPLPGSTYRRQVNEHVVIDVDPKTKRATKVMQHSNFSNDELYHFGVKGMRWGHRKAKSTSSNPSSGSSTKKVRTEEEKRALRKKVALGVLGAAALAGGAYAVKNHYTDKVLKDGASLWRVQGDGTGAYEGMYASFRKHDSGKYKGTQALKRKLINGGANLTEYGTSGKVHIASPHKAKKTFNDLYKNDEHFKNMADDLIKNWNGGNVRQIAVNRIGRRSKLTKYEAFNAAMTGSNSLYEQGAKKKYFDALRSQGVNAIRDVNDQHLSGFGNHSAIMYFGNDANVKSSRDIKNHEIALGIGGEQLRAYGKSAVGIYGAAKVYGAVSDAHAKRSVAKYKKKHPRKSSKMTDAQIAKEIGVQLPKSKQGDKK